MTEDNGLLTPDDKIHIAYALYDAGYPACWMRCICDRLVAGYGESVHGFRYELVVRDPQNIKAGIVPWDEAKNKLTSRSC